MEEIVPSRKDYVPSPVPTIVPRFAVDDENGYTYLEENGYAVFRDVATHEELEKGIELLWDFLEGLGVGIQRNDKSTWSVPEWPDPYGNGIVSGDGIGQSSFLWFVRGLPNVKQIFSKIWSTNELITSFDGCCIHRPFEYNGGWKTKTGWFHLDQNGHYKPKKLCVQGFLNFYPSGIHDGGLVVISKSHTIFNQIFHERPHLKKRGDFITLSNDKSLWQNTVHRAGLKAIKICAEPGDFVLWDSRTIHCNSPADTIREIPTDNTVLPPRRLVAYVWKTKSDDPQTLQTTPKPLGSNLFSQVCMTPKARLSPESHSARKDCYKYGQTTSHWPEDVSVPSSRKNRNKNYHPVPLTESQKDLIPF